MHSPVPQHPSQRKREIFQIRRSKDPISDRIGASHGHHFQQSATAFPVIYYKGRHGEFFVTADLYQPPGAPMYLLLYCPVCEIHRPPHEEPTSLRITTDNKAIDYDIDGQPKFPGFRTEEILAQLELPSLGGLLSVEPFGCTWESQPDARRAGRGIGGFSVCPWRVAIDRNIARDV